MKVNKSPTCICDHSYMMLSAKIERQSHQCTVASIYLLINIQNVCNDSDKIYIAPASMGSSAFRTNQVFDTICMSERGCSMAHNRLAVHRTTWASVLYMDADLLMYVVATQLQLGSDLDVGADDRNLAIAIDIFHAQQHHLLQAQFCILKGTAVLNALRRVKANRGLQDTTWRSVKLLVDEHGLKCLHEMNNVPYIVHFMQAFHGSTICRRIF